jgi:hypothetical protein
MMREAVPVAIMAVPAFAVPLKGGDPHDVVQNGQKLVHGSAPSSTD